MATISCLCCKVEISAEASRCYRCQESPLLAPGVFLIEYPLTDFERRRIPVSCMHRQGERADA